MTEFRWVRPNRACDAWSPSPMYASTSTMRAIRRASRSPSSLAASASRTSRAPIRPRAASSVGPASSRRSRSPDSRSVKVLDRLGEEEPEDVDDARDDRRVEEVTGARRVERFPEVPQEPDLLRVFGEPEQEVRVQDDRQERQQHRELEDAQDAAQDLVEPLVLLEQRDLLVGPLDDQRGRDDRG